jgi:hypothetical protein
MTSDSQSRGLLKYTSRDYNSIMSEFFDIVEVLTDLWKPEADSDPGVVLGKYLASVADMLGVNLDWLANEIYAPSVTQRKDAEKLFALIGYNLGWYTAARTEVTFKNDTSDTMKLDFGFSGNNFATLNAYTDITGTSRVITYNILPLTNKYGSTETRSVRATTSEDINVFSTEDSVTLEPGEEVTRVAIEGELRNYSVSVKDIINNNYIIKLPSQHLDTTAVWVKATNTQNSTDYLSTQWIQVDSPAEFTEPEPRFSVVYDTYSNAQIRISNYLNQLDNYSEDTYLVIYWIDCSGVIGCVGENVLQNLLFAVDCEYDEDGLTITNLSNTSELPNTYTITGKSPETAKEAYINSRNYINTFDSLVTLPDFNRFLNREPGVDCGLVIDCQKALEINLAIYYDENLTATQKEKMYITHNDFPASEVPLADWQNVLELDFDPTDPQHYVFATNFKPYTAMCFAVHNDFQNSHYGEGQTSNAKIKKSRKFVQYKPPALFIDAVVRDYKPLKVMTTQVEFGYLRVFPWYVVGQLYLKKSVTKDVGSTIIAKVKEALALYFAPANRSIGQKPTVMEVVNVIESADSRIEYFDAGSINNPVINYKDVDVEYFNPISYAQYINLDDSQDNLRIAPECLNK